MNIVYWSDYACPFCYIGETHLKIALERLGISETPIEMKAFELDPEASRQVQSDTTDRFAAKYGLPKDMAEARIEEISQIGREAGLDFRYASTRYTNTFDAHRLTKLAQDLGDELVTDRLIEMLYAAYFTENRELANPEVLKEIAGRAGLPDIQVSEVLTSDRYAEDVRLDEREAQRYGIHAVPFFLINGHATIPGAMGIAQMERLLRALLEQETENAAGETQGMTCGPEGCYIDL